MVTNNELAPSPAQPETQLPASGRLVVNADGLIASWSPEEGFLGDQELVRAAQLAAAAHIPVTFFELPPVIASTSSWVGALAALFDARPLRTLLVEAPVEVEDWIAENRHVCSGAEYGWDGDEELPPNAVGVLALETEER